MDKTNIMSILGILFAFIGVGAFIIIDIFMPDNGSLRFVGPLVFLGGIFISSVLLYKANPNPEAKILENYLEKQKLSKISFKEKDLFTVSLLENGFYYTEEGYYKKKKFSLFKDPISCYVRIIEAVDIENTIKREATRFDSDFKEIKKRHLLLFLYVDYTDEVIQQSLENVVKEYLIKERLYTDMILEAVIAVVVDKKTLTGYFLYIEKGGIFTFHAAAYKMLKELLIY